ncbi:MAG: hypothetical protein JPMHGGIA_02374 [Saprospiraceae bacterium]|nr:hypothetical protein [Saprospiraceae bacterium]
MKTIFTRFWPYMAALPILFFLTRPLTAQRLEFRPGELIVHGAPDFQPLNAKARKSGRSGIPAALQPVRQLGPAWNIWLFRFDHARYRGDELMQSLASLPEVVAVQRNRILKPRRVPDDVHFSLLWHHVNDGSLGGATGADFDSDLAWDLCTGGVTSGGDSIVVCIIDDGVETSHEDIAPSLWYNRGEIPNNQLDDDGNGYVDDFGGWNSFKGNDVFDPGKHGTAVTGLAGARGNNGLGITGMAWNNRILFVAGGGDEANAIESYAYPLIMRRLYRQTQGKKGAFVVATNASWGADFGRPEDAPLWCAVYDSLGAEGILNVASTTNQNIDVEVEGDLPTTCPSDFLITVTNVTIENVKRTNAGYGSQSIDLGAYGESTYSTYPGNSYRSFGGTSAAAPQVCGAIGLLYSLPCSNLPVLAYDDPPMAAKEVRRVLLESVVPNPSLAGITRSGGVLNSFRALMTSSPLIQELTADATLSWRWEANAILPVDFRFRKAGTPVWTDTVLTAGTQFSLYGLEVCTDYEVQFRRLCDRYSSEYSPVRKYKTGGCCDPIDKIQVINAWGNRVAFSYQDPSAGSRTTALLRRPGSIPWDTFQLKENSGHFELDQLEPCSSYEMLLYSHCNGRPSLPPDVFRFSSGGCGQCTEADYCRRFRPSAELEWLESVVFNTTGFVTGNDKGYGNYVGTDKSWFLITGLKADVHITAGYLADTSLMIAAVWIDFDQDGSFSDSENIAPAATKFTGTLSFASTIPGDAEAGWTRMRIMVKFAEFSDAPPTPCFQSLEFGEYEDYCVLISDGNCDVPWPLVTDRTELHRALLKVTKPPSFAYQYAFRKLYELDWVYGRSTSSDILLEGLDSCTRYELLLRNECMVGASAPRRHRFSTLGSNCITATDDHEFAGSLRIFPNPVNGLLHLSTEHSVAWVECISIDGIVHRLPLLPGMQVDVSALAAGHYVIRMKFLNGKRAHAAFVKI